MNIYIGNLNYRVRENDLQEVLAEFGTVTSVKIVKDRITGRSKGFGFCDIENDDDARRAIDSLNGYDLQGRPLVLKEALARD